ncbi:MAG: hypothetical protein HUJ65_06330 [Oscillospiraceae bacterium]|nr:hypothetical protein [Oscillospiraceae bacterium]
MKKTHIILIITGAVLAVAAAVSFILIFRDEISDFFYDLHDSICARRVDRMREKMFDGYTDEFEDAEDEFADFADV